MGASFFQGDANEGRNAEYPYVLFNDQEHKQEFIDRIAEIVPSSRVTFSTIPKAHWTTPSSIDPALAASTRKEMKKMKIQYGGLESFRLQAQWLAGWMWRETVLDEYEWYWRVEPGVVLGCDVDYDPFLWMQSQKKRYGFGAILKENIGTSRAPRLGC